MTILLGKDQRGLGLSQQAFAYRTALSALRAGSGSSPTAPPQPGRMTCVGVNRISQAGRPTASGPRCLTLRVFDKYSGGPC